MASSNQTYLLRVNLTTGNTSREPIPEDYLTMFLGGRVLGDIYLYNELDAGIDALEASVDKAQSISKPNMQARSYRDTVIPAMGQVREAADTLETLVDADLWPLPSYAEMLFLR